MSWFYDGPPEELTVHNVPGGQSYIDKTANLAGQIYIGKFCFIGGNSHIIAIPYPVHIGSFTSIAHNFYCATAESHQTEFVTTSRLNLLLGLDLSYSDIKNPRRDLVEIGSDVWIGSDVKLIEGVQVSNGSVIGACSLVNKDCEPFGIYGGVPARLIKFRFSDKIIEQLMGIKWWEWDLAKIQRNTSFFNLNLTRFDGDLKDFIID